MSSDPPEISRDETIGGVPTLPRGEPPMVVAGRYRTIRLIARGGMASVYLAEQLALHRAVALKILHPPLGGDAEDRVSFERRFQLEAQTLATLVHPNIVTVYDYGPTEDGRFFLAMEHIDGPRFTDLLVHGTLPPDRAIQLLLQVCGALRYAHKRGVVHRDLKPSNLLIARDADGQEQVKVVDFGLVKVGEFDQSLTREGVVMGSPHCMAPEQVQGGPIDARADIYALGVLLFRSITGAYPFHGANATATMMLHLTSEVPRFLDVAPELRIVPAIEAVVRRCLARNPADRYPDVVALAQELAPCVGLVPQMDTTSRSLTLDEPPQPAPRRWVAWVSALGLAGVVALGAVAWLLAPGPDDARTPAPAHPEGDAASLTAEGPTASAGAAADPAGAADAPPTEGTVDPGADPGAAAAQGATAAQAGDGTAKPEQATAKPEEATAKPGETTAKPGETTAKPGETTAKPGETTAKPATSSRPRATTPEPAPKAAATKGATPPAEAAPEEVPKPIEGMVGLPDELK